MLTVSRLDNGYLLKTKRCFILYLGMLMYFGYSMLHSVKERKQKEKELYEQQLQNKQQNMTSGDMTKTAEDYTNVTGTAAVPVGYQGQGNGYAHPGAPASAAYNSSGTGVAPAPTYQPAPNPNNPFLPQNQPQGNESWQQQAQQQQQPARAGGDGGYDYQERRVRYDDEQQQQGDGVHRRNQQFAAQYDPYAGREEYGYQEDNRMGGDGREEAASARGTAQYPRQVEPTKAPAPAPAPQRPAYQAPERDEWGRRIGGGKGAGGYYQ